MIIQITPDGYIPVSGDAPKIGRKYSLEDATTGTLAQGKAWHALAQEFWKSGLHSYPAKNFMQFRDFLKRDIGDGFESYVYATPEGIKNTRSLDDVPNEYRNARYCMGRLKSWADYTQTERRDSIDRLIATMDAAGVNSRKYQEIINGMSNGNASFLTF